MESVNAGSDTEKGEQLMMVKLSTRREGRGQKSSFT